MTPSSIAPPRGLKRSIGRSLAAALAGGVPSITFIGDERSALIGGGQTSLYPFPRENLDLVALAASDQLFQNGFE